jgi:D-glucuronyl C5-epimerase C-terminus
MRRITLAATALCALCAGGPLAATGEAARVLEVMPHGVHAVEEPALGGPWSLAGPLPATRRARPAAKPLAVASRRDEVKATVRRAFAAGAIDAATRDRYLDSWSSALGTYRGLRGQRRVELGYVIATLERLAAKKRLDVRLAPAFLLLERNRQWWAKAGPPASGARIRFAPSRVIFQYFPNEGLQIHPLANFGQANGFWYAHRNNDLRSLLQDLEAIAVDRGGFLTWEYYFAYGGGAPPWISGMAQGTAMQAYARASKRLSDPSLLEVASRARGAFERNTPVGVHAPQGSEDWYALYSFAPRLNVLNGMLQAVNGVRSYTEFTNDPVAQRVFEAGDRTARAVIAKFDTGAWSLYDRPNGRPGHEANLNYHTLNRDFARNLCKATKAEAYCTAQQHFTDYLSADPTLDPVSAVPAPAKGGKGVKFRFKLSKIGRVSIVVKEADSGRTYLATSAFLAYGSHWFRWVPPKRAGEHTYTYKLSASDLAGNSSSVDGDLRVLGARGGKPAT